VRTSLGARCGQCIRSQSSILIVAFCDSPVTTSHDVGTLSVSRDYDSLDNLRASVVLVNLVF
jgi:hypothetical protein